MLLSYREIFQPNDLLRHQLSQKVVKYSCQHENTSKFVVLTTFEFCRGTIFREYLKVLPSVKLGGKRRPPSYLSFQVGVFEAMQIRYPTYQDGVIECFRPDNNSFPPL